MTKTIEERIAEIKLVANHAADRNQSDHSFGLDQGRRIMANQAMSIINDLQAKLNEQTQRADLLILELTKAYDKEHARDLKDQQRGKKLDEITKEVEKILAENEKLKTLNKLI